MTSLTQHRIRAQQPALDATSLRKAFGAFPSGVVAVAAIVDGNQVGLAASSFTSISLDPALASFAIAHTSSTWPVLRRSQHLGLSVLAEHHRGACRQLAGPASQRFDGIAVRTTPDGALLLTDAVATFDCSIEREIAAGDHTIVLLRLHTAETHDDTSPLLFHRSGFNRLDASSADPTLGGGVAR